MKVFAALFFVAVVRARKGRLIVALDKRHRVMDPRLTEKGQGLGVDAEVLFIMRHHVGIGGVYVIEQLGGRTKAFVVDRVFFWPEYGGNALFAAVTDDFDQLVHAVGA